MESRSIIFLVTIAVFVHFVATNFTYTKGAKLRLLTEDNYYDIIHHNFNDYSALHYAKNAITALFVFPFLANLNKISMIPQKFLLIIPLLIIIRGLFTSVTIFPATRKNGPNKPETSPISFFNYFFGDNYDRMFSGHISFAIIASFLIFNLNILQINLFNLTLLILLNLIHAFVIVATRSHYTIDVLNSALITALLIKSV